MSWMLIRRSNEFLLMSLMLVVLPLCFLQSQSAGGTPK